MIQIDQCNCLCLSNDLSSYFANLSMLISESDCVLSVVTLLHLLIVDCARNAHIHGPPIQWHFYTCLTQGGRTALSGGFIL